MENSGIYKKLCVHIVYNGVDGLGCVLCVYVLSQSHTSKDHKSCIKEPAKCLLTAGGCGIVVGIPTLFECQPH